MKLLKIQPFQLSVSITMSLTPEEADCNLDNTKDEKVKDENFLITELTLVERRYEALLKFYVDNIRSIYEPNVWTTLEPEMKASKSILKLKRCSYIQKTKSSSSF